jgi:hypothetical protein
MGEEDTVHLCVEKKFVNAEIKGTQFLAISIYFESQMGDCAGLWVRCVESWGREHHGWCNGMARYHLLAHGMHLYVELELMETNKNKHAFNDFFFVIFRHTGEFQP